MFEVTLECGHKRIFTFKRLLPKLNSFLDCRNHEAQTISKVVKIGRGYVVECETEGGKLIKDRLSDESYIRRFGYGHLKQYPDHKVVVYVDGDRKKETMRVIKAPNITHQTDTGF